MENRKTHYNPIFGDKITFLKTSEETNGLCTLMELELPSGTPGVITHYHTEFTESFTILEGELTVHIGKEKRILKKGDKASVPPNTLHRWYNASKSQVTARVELTPGHTNFERSLIIAYGLARDGKCDSKGVVKDKKQLSIILDMSATKLPGLFSLIVPVLKMMAKKARKQGIEKDLIAKYCP
ncbi:MAG: cupin domain-containing protein [Bacteroidetes bacterium]|nr:cupin domain-containing protein [Bacteroidota bacterium]